MEAPRVMTDDEYQHLLLIVQAADNFVKALKFAVNMLTPDMEKTVTADVQAALRVADCHFQTIDKLMYNY